MWNIYQIYNSTSENSGILKLKKDLKYLNLYILMRYALLRMYYINISLKNEVNQCDENHGTYITWYSEIGAQVISNLC